mmetsp:Transcript_70836/g.207564  ORF Transcript_70836/g.207564 Transcript_70836/m.207564 type:complete len:242 (+) Transcript_70836:1727-2452(+)
MLCDRVLHIEAHHKDVALHQQDGGLPRGLPNERRPVSQLLLAHEHLSAGRPALAGQEGPIRVALEERGHLAELDVGTLHVVGLDILRDVLDPRLQGEVVLREVQDVEEGDHHDEDDRERGHLRGHHVPQLVRDDHGDAAMALRVVLEARQEPEDPQHPGEPACPRAHAAEAHALHEQELPLGQRLVHHVRLTCLVAQKVGYVKDDGECAEDVHDVEEAEEVHRVRGAQRHGLQREEHQDHG